MTRVYLDHHAATPLVPAALAAMRQALPLAWANPSSVHAEGRAARAILERARDQIAAAFDAAPADVVLTSGGTEALNLAILGIAHARGARHIATTTIEHPAVAETLRRWERSDPSSFPRQLTRVPVPHGILDPTDFPRAQKDGVDMVVMQWASHETGSILPPVPDAVLDASQTPATHGDAAAMVVASHKLGGPPGAAAVILKRGVEMSPLLGGGAQERGRRAGSPDVVAAAGFGAACSVLAERLAAMPAVAARRDALEQELVARGGVVNGADAPRVATVTNVSFHGQRGDLLVAALDVEGIAVASGAACSSGLAAPSPVLLAMYADEPWRAASALRFSLGPETTDDDVRLALAALDRVLSRSARSAS